MIVPLDKISEMLVGAAVAVPVTYMVTSAWEKFRSRVFDLRSARGIFNFTSETTHVFLPLNSPTDGGAASGFGDLLALVELIAVIERLHQTRHQISVYSADDEKNMLRTSQHNVISIGGYKHNRVYRELIDRLEPPYQFWHQTRRAPREIRNKNGTAIFQAQRDDKGNLIRDVGLALRAPSPFDEKKTVIIVAGAHTYGSVAAMKFLCSPQKGRSLVSTKAKRTLVVVGCDVASHAVGAIRPLTEIIEW